MATSWEIDRLCLRLPAGFGDRAAEIARLVGESLAHASESGPSASLELGTLAVPPVRLSSPGQSNAEIAAGIAAGIRQSAAAAGGAK